MRGDRPADEDRLPWLEPYKDAIASKQRVARRSHGPLVAFVTALILIPMAVAAGFWFGQRSSKPQPRPSQIIAIAPPKVESPPVVSEVPEAAPVAEAPPARPKAKAAARPVRKTVHHRAPPRRKIRTAGVERAHIDAVRARQEAVARSRPWPRMPSPGPAGQVIQLGAFTTAARANNAYQLRLARYPLLGRMPKVVVPVFTKPGGRILYVLRLGTTSRQQSKTVCRNLQRSGDHCLVIG